MKYRAKSIGAAALLLCVSLASNALTLGNLRGPAIIGRALDVTVPVQVEQTDNAAASCFEAEVFHADVRQAASRVRVSVEPAGAAQSIVVRVKSSALINEPVVTVVLRARCDTQAQRRYVLLADLPPAVDLNSPVQIGRASDASSSSSSSSSSGGLNPAAESSVSSSLVTDAPPAKPRRVGRAKPPVSTNELLKSIAKATDRASKKAAAPSGQSRLQLDNSELFSDRIALLDQEQPDAALDYVSPDQQKLQEMQGTIQSLQTAAAQNNATLQELKVRLKQSETERFPAWLVAVLAGLVLAAIAAIGVLWVRQRRVQAQVREAEWWSESAAMPDSTAPPLVGAGRSVPSAPVPLVKPKVGPRLEPDNAFRPSSQWLDSKTYGVDVNEVEMRVSRFHRFTQTDQGEKDLEGHSVGPSLDLINPESQRLDAALTAEVRQQAEFFVALGQTDQAVIVLEKLIQDSQVPNPNVFLDLLGLLHSLRKKPEFQRYREDFNRLFHVIAPEFVRFKSEGRSLEDYPAILSDVIAHWAGPDALECINAHVLRPPHQSPGGALDLAAFRDMLLLQAIVQQLKTQEMDPDGESSAVQGRPTPVLAPQAVEPDELGFTHMMVLDLDLSDAGAVQANADPGGFTSGSEAPVTVPSALNANGSTGFQNANLLDFDLTEYASSDDKGRVQANADQGGFTSGSQAPVTLSSELKANASTGFQNITLVDFDLSDDVQPSDPDRKS